MLQTFVILARFLSKTKLPAFRLLNGAIYAIFAYFFKYIRILHIGNFGYFYNFQRLTKVNLHFLTM